MNNAYRSGYKKQDIYTLLKAIDECTSLSQLFALIQHEQIEIQMHAQSGASNLQPRKLTAENLAENKDIPIDRLKSEVKKAVCGRYQPPDVKGENSELVKAIRATKTLTELFELIQKEHIVVQMHAQSGASNLEPKKLTVSASVDKNENPFERFKSEVIRSVSNQGE